MSLEQQLQQNTDALHQHTQVLQEFMQAFKQGEFSFEASTSSANKLRDLATSSKITEQSRSDHTKRKYNLEQARAALIFIGKAANDNNVAKQALIKLTGVNSLPRVEKHDYAKIVQHAVNEYQFQTN